MAKNAERSWKECYRKLLDNKRKLGMMVVADAGLLLAVLLFRELIASILPGSGLGDLLAGSGQAVTYLTILIVLYYAFLVLLYSLAKHLVLDQVKSLWEKKVISLGRFWTFYGLNLLLVGVLLLVALGLGYVVDATIQPYDLFVGPALFLPFFLVAYVLVNLSHSAFFARGEKVLEAFSSGVLMLGQGSRYGIVLGISLLLGGGVWLLFFIAGLAIRMVAEHDFALYASVYGVYQQITVYVFTAVLYGLLVYNRALFYKLVSRK